MCTSFKGEILAGIHAEGDLAIRAARERAVAGLGQDQVRLIEQPVA